MLIYFSPLILLVIDTIAQRSVDGLFPYPRSRKSRQISDYEGLYLVVVCTYIDSAILCFGHSSPR